MKRIFALFVVGLVLASSGVAMAEIPSGMTYYGDDFEDGVMNPGMWDYSTDGSSGAALTENGVLNFTIPANGGGDLYAAYTSKWSMNFSNSFGFSVQYSNTYDGAGSGCIGMDVGRDAVGSDFFAGGDITRTGNITTAGIYIEGDGVTPVSLNQVIGNDGGWIGVMYTKDADTFAVGFFNEEPSETALPVFGQEFANFTNNYNPGTLNLYLGGYSENSATVSMGQVTMDNFKGGVAPEPVSSALFLLGGTAMAVRQYRKRRKA